MIQELTVTSCQAANTFTSMAEIGHYLTEKLSTKWNCAFRYIPIDESTDATAKKHYAMAPAGEFDISWVCAATYARVMHQAERKVDLLVAPQFSHQAYQNQPVYFSYLLVRADSPYRTFADLSGKRFVYNETVSLSGHNTVCAHLQSLGIEQGYFSAAVASGGHLKSIGLLVDAETDCVAIDSSVWHWYQSQRPDICDQLRCILMLEPYAAPPWIISRAVPQDLAQEIRSLLLELHREDFGRKLLKLGGMSAFCGLDNRHYESALHAVRMGETIPLTSTA